ncbi:MAG: phosphoribosylamine--glycine ligase [Oscillospiraceae bacterium]|nr:phosphoribosylamine--glycine ligase [Oscillospiraceae bacterium]
MKILVIGGGGREHAIIMKLAESKRVEKLYCAPGNGGISRFAECFDVKATDLDGIVALAKKIMPDMTVVAPDDPLVLGMVDALNAEGFATFGPSKAAAIIEGSKAFAKELMEKYNIPTAKYKIFDNSIHAIEYIRTENKYPVVIKADGLALGKGVIIAQNEEEARRAVQSIMEDGIFGKSGEKVVVEEFLTGTEATVLAFTDGKTLIPLISSKDHKRALDGDRGLNTGGMGTIAPNPAYTPQIADECMEKIFLPTMKAMAAQGRRFKGCLYFGLMLTKDGVKVIEYNCRFGDPETQVILPLLDTDLADIFEAVYHERLSEIDIKWKEQHCACVIMASGGYPQGYQTGLFISGLNNKGQSAPDITVYHSGTKFEGNDFLTSGGRVLGITASGKTLDEALEKTYSAVKKINFKDSFYRNDIGQLQRGLRTKD